MTASEDAPNGGRYNDVSGTACAYGRAAAPRRDDDKTACRRVGVQRTLTPPPASPPGWTLEQTSQLSTRSTLSPHACMAAAVTTFAGLQESVVELAEALTNTIPWAEWCMFGPCDECFGSKSRPSSLPPRVPFLPHGPSPSAEMHTMTAWLRSATSPEARPRPGAFVLSVVRLVVQARTATTPRRWHSRSHATLLAGSVVRRRDARSRTRRHATPPNATALSSPSQRRYVRLWVRIRRTAIVVGRSPQLDRTPNAPRTFLHLAGRPSSACHRSDQNEPPTVPALCPCYCTRPADHSPHATVVPRQRGPVEGGH